MHAADASRQVHSARRRLPSGLRTRVTRLYRPLLYRGSSVECPCCGGRFRRLISHRGRPNVRCPRCGSMERHRLLSLWLDGQSWLDEPGLRVLHFAPEPPLRRRLEALPSVDYLPADLDSPLGEPMDVMDIPRSEASFDLVVCNHVLEHVPDDRRALRELRRVLAPGGRGIIMSPIGRDTAITVEDGADLGPQERLSRFGQEDHVRLYGADYDDRLREAGFEVEVHDVLAGLDEETVRVHALRQRHPRFEDDVVHLARVR